MRLRSVGIDNRIFVLGAFLCAALVGVSAPAEASSLFADCMSDQGDFRRAREADCIDDYYDVYAGPGVSWGAIGIVFGNCARRAKSTAGYLTCVGTGLVSVVAGNLIDDILAAMTASGNAWKTLKTCWQIASAASAMHLQLCLDYGGCSSPGKHI